MSDTVEKWQNSTIQHGPLNSRVYIMHLDRRDFPEIIGATEVLAGKNTYEKIFAKVPAVMAPVFEKRGFLREALIPEFFRDDAVFLSKYLIKARGVERYPEKTALILEQARRREGILSLSVHDPSFEAAPCQPSDAAEMSRLFKEVYRTYPFPIDDPSYLMKAMETHVRYFCVRWKNKIVAIGSSEMDRENLSVEMTDFATLPAWTGRGLASLLLVQMETGMALEGMRTAFTIARALSAGMNRVFFKGGYRYAGTLTNNTQISGRIESMNVWYKSLEIREE